MRLVDLIPLQYRVLVVGLLLCALAAASSAIAWTVQGWRYGQQLEKQARLHTETLNQITLASAALQRTERDKRLALEQQLAANDQTHYRALTDAQRDQDRLRDRLATADVRLSVLLDATDTASGCEVPATTTTTTTTGTGGVVMEPHEPDLTRRMLNELSASPMREIGQ